MERVELVGRTIAYVDEGRAERGTVLALHSLGTDHRLWSGPAAQLVHAGYRVVRPDARGHGASTWAPLDGPGAWAQDLEAVLDAAGVSQACVLGASMGCAQALELALAQPARVEALVLTGGFGDLERDVADAKAQGLVGGASAQGMEAWADAYVESTLVTDDPAARALLRDLVRSVALEVYTASARATFAPRSGSLRDIAAPVLVIWGRDDAKTPRPMSAALVDDLPSATLQELPGAGHLAALDTPEAFTELVARFLADVAHPMAAGSTERPKETS